MRLVKRRQQVDRRCESFVPLALGVIPVDVLSTRPCHGNKHARQGSPRESAKQREGKAWRGHNRVVALGCYAIEQRTSKPEGRRFVIATKRTTATRFQSKMTQVQTTQVQTTQVQTTQVQAHLAVVKQIRRRRRRR